MNIRMIGHGRLGKILAQQWCQTHLVMVSSPSLEEAIHQDKLQTIKGNTKNLDVDFIILAVKPHLIHDILKEISPHLNPKTPIISLAAGMTLAQMEIQLPHQPIVRAMPNINAEVQASATILLKNQNITAIQQSQVEKLFSSIGTIDWVDNDTLLDIGTILASSGPAYVFYLMEAFQSAASALGMDEELSQKLLTQTFMGSAKLAQQKKDHLTKLIDAVVSPQGTTAAALEVLNKHQIKKSLDEAIHCAWQRVLDIRKIISEI